MPHLSIVADESGHLPSDFENETYRQILLNCLTWNPT